MSFLQVFLLVISYLSSHETSNEVHYYKSLNNMNDNTKRVKYSNLGLHIYLSN